MKGSCLRITATRVVLWVHIEEKGDGELRQDRPQPPPTFPESGWQTGVQAWPFQALQAPVSALGGRDPCHHHFPVPSPSHEGQNIPKTQVVSCCKCSCESITPSPPRKMEQGFQGLPDFKHECPLPSHKTPTSHHPSSYSSIITFPKKWPSFNSFETFLWIAISIFFWGLYWVPHF